MSTITGPRVMVALEDYLAWSPEERASEAFETLLCMSHNTTRQQLQLAYARNNPADTGEMNLEIIEELHAGYLRDLVEHGLASEVCRG